MKSDQTDGRDPYDWPKGYTWHWVHIDRYGCHRGWDGVYRRIDRDGTVTPPFPEEDDHGQGSPHPGH